ncbi:hypothetical protein Tco_0074942 [Tanacetum coccineum]
MLSFLNELGYANQFLLAGQIMTTDLPQPKDYIIHLCIQQLVGHILTEHPDILKRLNEPYHRVDNDKVVKLIFNSRKRKGLGMMIPEWMLTDEMKHTKHYKLYDEEFGIDILMIQSQPTESTQGANRT